MLHHDQHAVLAIALNPSQCGHTVDTRRPNSVMLCLMATSVFAVGRGTASVSVLLPHS